MLEEMKTCPFCAESIKRAAIRCRYCGSDLPKDAEQSGETLQPREHLLPNEEHQRTLGAQNVIASADLHLCRLELAGDLVRIRRSGRLRTMFAHPDRDLRLSDVEEIRLWTPTKWAMGALQFVIRGEARSKILGALGAAKDENAVVAHRDGAEALLGFARALDDHLRDNGSGLRVVSQEITGTEKKNALVGFLFVLLFAGAVTTGYLVYRSNAADAKGKEAASSSTDANWTVTYEIRHGPSVERLFATTTVNSGQGTASFPRATLPWKEDYFLKPGQEAKISATVHPSAHSQRINVCIYGKPSDDPRPVALDEFGEPKEQTCKTLIGTGALSTSVTWKVGSKHKGL